MGCVLRLRVDVDEKKKKKRERTRLSMKTKKRELEKHIPTQFLLLDSLVFFFSFCSSRGVVYRRVLAVGRLLLRIVDVKKEKREEKRTEERMVDVAFLAINCASALSLLIGTI